MTNSHVRFSWNICIIDVFKIYDESVAVMLYKLVLSTSAFLLLRFGYLKGLIFPLTDEANKRSF